MRKPERRMRAALAAWAIRGGAALGGVLALTRLRHAWQDAAAGAPGADRREGRGTPEPLPPPAAQGAGGSAGQGERIGRGRPETPPSPQARRAGHETEDMSGRTMALLALGLGGAVACAIGLMVALVGHLDRARDAGRPSYTAQQTAPVVPPNPRLQAAPLADIAQLRAREDALLHGYAWTDKARTRARIPIERAMALTQGRSLDAPP